MSDNVNVIVDDESGYVPQVDSLFVPTPDYQMVMDVLKADIFYPTLLTGPSGTGKTKNIEQACASTKRSLFRINLTIESDEDSLMGGFRLKDGNTHFVFGPIIKAMQEGAVCLLDEVDLASPTKIMCLQSVMEGNGYYSKKTQEWIVPKEGFQIFATANTKGLGDDTGSFVGTQNLNEAFLERFPATFEVDYPTPQIETDILLKMAIDVGLKNTADDLIKALVKFANEIRKGVKSGNLQYQISTRRLIHMIKAYKIWGNHTRAMKVCLNRYDASTRESYLDIWNSLAPLSAAEQEKIRKEAESRLDLRNLKPYGAASR